MSGRSVKKVKTKAPISDVGKGIPKEFIPLLKKKGGKGKIVQPRFTDSEFSLISAAFDLKVFKFDDDKIDPSKENKEKVGLDVTALDRYNDEVRRYRKVVIEECRNLPTKSEMANNSKILITLQVSIEKLCRNAYYGTAKAQKLAEGALPLLVWILNRQTFPDDFIIKVHKCVSELCWTSLVLKAKFCNCHGMKVLYHNIKQARQNKRLGCWAVYAMAMIATGSAEAIKKGRAIKGMQEHVAELSFEYYWYDWPVNFGMVLQGIIYGPHSVCPNENLFQYR